LRLISNPNKYLIIVNIEAFFARLGFGLITFTLPFFALSLGMSYAEIGILVALRLVIAILLKPWMGYAVDKFGKRTIYLLSISGRTLVGILFIFANAAWMLYAIRILHGITTAARDPVSAVYISEHGAKSKKASAFAWYGTWREAGAVIGYMAAGIMLTASNDNYQYVFVVSVITSALALLLVYLFIGKDIKPDSQDRTEPAPSPTIKNQWIELSILGLMMALTGTMVNNLFPLIATEFASLSKAQTSIIYALSTTTIIVLGPFFGWLSDNVSRHIVLAFRSIANAVSSLLYPLFPNFAGLCIARISDDAGKAAFRPAWGDLMAEYSNQGAANTRGRRIAQLDTAQSAGEALGPVLAGFLWDHFGILWLFAVRFILALISEAYYVYLIKKNVISSPK